MLDRLNARREQRDAAPHRREVILGIVLEDAEIAVGAVAVAAVAGDDADVVGQDAELKQFAEGAVRRAVIMKLRDDRVLFHPYTLPGAAIGAPGPVHRRCRTAPASG